MAAFDANIDSNEATFLIVGILIAGLFALYSRFSSKLKVPGPGFRQYLPGGIAYPLYKDQKAFTTTLDALSREYGDVYQMRFGTSLALVTAVPEDIVHIYSSIDLFPRSPGVHETLVATFPRGIFSMQGELHKATRKTLRDSFNYSMLESFHPHMVDAVNELCDTLTRHAEEQSKTNTPKVVDISEELATTTFRILMNVAFGMGVSQRERLQMAEIFDVLANELMKDFIGYPIRQALTRFGVRKQLIESEKRFRTICQSVIKTRLKETKNEKDGRHGNVLDTILSLNNIEAVSTASMTMEFAVAGSHTTNTTLVWCLFEVCRNPHVVQRIDEELSSHLGDRALSEPVTVEDMKKLSYFNSLWKETLRIHSVGAGALRQVQKDVTLRGSGTFVPKGTQVMAHTSRAQTHERIWKDPLSFKPERWEPESGYAEGDHVSRGCYIPFGVGPKACAGRFLADYEGPLVLIELYRRFRFQLACEPHEVVCSSNFVDVLKTSSKVGGPLDRGLPLIVTLK